MASSAGLLVPTPLGVPYYRASLRARGEPDVHFDQRSDFASDCLQDPGRKAGLDETKGRTGRDPAGKAEQAALYTYTRRLRQRRRGGELARKRSAEMHVPPPPPTHAVDAHARPRSPR